MDATRFPICVQFQHLASPHWGSMYFSSSWDWMGFCDYLNKWNVLHDFVGEVRKGLCLTICFSGFLTLEPCHQAMRKPKPAHTERPPEEELSPLPRVGFNYKTHEWWVPAPILGSSYLRSLTVWRRKTILALLCPNSWPTESMNITNGCFRPQHFGVHIN